MAWLVSLLEAEALVVGYLKAAAVYDLDVVGESMRYSMGISIGGTGNQSYSENETIILGDVNSR